jgi:hypothetical protein
LLVRVTVAVARQSVTTAFETWFEAGLFGPYRAVESRCYVLPVHPA